MRRDVVWEFIGQKGLEHLTLTLEPEEIVAEGIVVVDLGDGPFRLDYRIICDGAWDFRRADISLDRGRAQARIEILRDETGWSIDGRPRPDLADCTFIDIRATPFTNTLPIRRLRLAPDERRVIEAVYVPIPDLAVSAVEQAYTRLDAEDPPSRFHYHGIAGNFQAELSVDADGIIIDYPPIWRRRTG
ncbi:MAG: putative glycolipid-binding domain-containing protein [Proteobacteria bacterium]|nr:putative glycolipid-binding domain-containing protein [Pseudomonadota bacterium]MBI3500052.1 putative glycolipid-binding domain-containing protein [Pseudomonadota bacterium]